VTTAAPDLIRRLKLAGLLVVLGLIVEAITLFWSHPTAFLVFLFLGALLVVAGVLLYLFAIATYSAPPAGSKPEVP
jgi:hypothetical protein